MIIIFSRANIRLNSQINIKIPNTWESTAISKQRVCFGLFYISLFRKINLNKIAMKKVFVSFCMAATLMGLSSCASTKNVNSLFSEWRVEYYWNKRQCKYRAHLTRIPFIGFDTKTGKVYGNSGCTDWWALSTWCQARTDRPGSWEVPVWCVLTWQSKRMCWPL